MRAAAIVVALGVVLGGALLVTGFSTDSPAPRVERRILLVSGRDDHGLLAQKTVGLSRLAGGETTARVPDGTLVEVTATHGEWLEVRTLERTSARGWVNDFYLRGTAHVIRRTALPRNAQVELLALESSRVRVRAVATGETAWVSRALVRELPAT